MKTFILTTATLLGLSLLASDAAHAGGVNFYVGGGQPYYGGSYGGVYGGGGYGLGYSSGYYPSYGGSLGGAYYAPRTTQFYHNTGHYDYVPTQIVPHGNHYDVQPGGYYYHQTGHIDTLHGNHIHHGYGW